MIDDIPRQTLNTRRSLTSQLVWRVIILSVIALFGVLTTMTTGIVVALLQSQNDVQTIAHNASHEIDRVLFTTVEQLHTLGTTLQHTPTPDLILREFLEINPAILSIKQLDTEGYVLYNRQRIAANTPDRYLEQPWVETVNPQFVTIPDTQTGLPLIQIATPLWETSLDSTRNTRRGTLIVLLDLTAYWDILRQARIGDAGFTYMIDAERRVLVHPNLQRVQNATLAPDYLQSWFNNPEHDPFTTLTLRRGLESPFALTAVEYLEYGNWLIVVERPVGDVLKDWIWWTIPLALLVGVGIWAILSIAHFMRRRVITPLEMLRTSVERFQRGDMTQRIYLSGQIGDEIDLLTQTFNDMAASIESRTRALVVANDRAEENARLKSEFLSMISHELRTPLNAIMGYTGILLEGLNGNMDDTARRMVSRIDLNSQRLLDLINDLLNLGQIERGELDINKHPFNPHKLAQNWEEQYRILVERKGLAYNVTVAPGVPDILYGDPARITQIISNLLSNAVKFTDEGSISVHIAYDITSWSITVKDTGIGIPQDALRFIFEKFRQVDASTTREYGGTGLGLTIVMELCKLMGGQVRVSSVVMEGSSFTVTLPVLLSETDKPPAVSRIIASNPTDTP